MILIHIPRLRVEGMALFPFVLVRPARPGPVLLNHERIHLRQQAELGVLPFYVCYGLEYLYWRMRLKQHLPAYFAISFEREAYAREADLTYLDTRPVWAFRRYLSATAPR
jgi:hypothetical protein